MGKLHRLKRRIEKSTLKRLGLRETELGELRKVASKAEARRRALRRHYIGMSRQHVYDALCQKVAQDVAAEEDARFLESIESTLAALRATSEASQR